MLNQLSQTVMIPWFPQLFEKVRFLYLALLVVKSAMLYFVAVRLKNVFRFGHRYAPRTSSPARM